MTWGTGYWKRWTPVPFTEWEELAVKKRAQ